jgi:hypothetical protein
MGLPTATVDANGRVEQITVNVRNDIALITPRQLLQYRVDTADAPDVIAWGVVVTCPPVDSPGAGPDDGDPDSLQRVTAVGLEKLLADRMIGPRLYDRSTMVALGSNDVAAVAFDLATLYTHPAVIVDEDDFPDTGATVGLFYAPETSLADGLDELVGMVPGGARWWVDGYRHLHFEANS